GQVQTMRGHTHGRLQMESYLRTIKNLRVINTTKYGAKINGTEYMPLEDVIKEFFKDKIVEPAWDVNEKPKYDMQAIKQNANKMEKQRIEFLEAVDQIVKVLQKMETLVNYKETRQLLKTFPRLDRTIKQMLNNDF